LLVLYYVPRAVVRGLANI